MARRVFETAEEVEPSIGLATESWPGIGNKNEVDEMLESEARAISLDGVEVWLTGIRLMSCRRLNY